MTRRGLEPHQICFVLLLATVAFLEMYYEFVGLQVTGIPKGPVRQPSQPTVIEALREEWGRAGHHHPLLTKYLTAGLGLPHVNASSMVMHGSLSASQAKLLDLTSRETEEINQVLPEEDFVHHYSSCALVGNSASLVQYQFGNEIDSHDVVLRFNDAPTRGYEEHVGRRCTFRAITQEHVRLLMGVAKPGAEKGHKEKTKPGARTLLMMPDNPMRFYSEMRHKFPENVIMYISPEIGLGSQKIYDSVVERLAGLGDREAEHADKHATGISAAFFLMQMCKKVSLYGFQPVAPPAGSSMPSMLYYDKVLTDSDITASAMSFLFWRVMNMENNVRLRC
mmetsp:Transcript_22773/g.63242  ORF Transcript_22773/g.63242 Transcript_22773/m.63242 type:complete len:336 (-) Transcript_22773:338-1345(-)